MTAFANDPRYFTNIDNQYLWIESLVHQHYLADDQEIPPYETPTYIIHQNGIITDNRSSNLVAASYDEYCHFLERDSGPNATRERVLRTDIPELFYNPYYHDKTLPDLQFPYIINTDDEIRRKAGERNVKVKERNSNAKGTFLELWDTKHKASIRFNVAVGLIQTFITMDPEQRIPIYIDGNLTHAYLANLRNGSYDDYIKDTINRLPKKDGEIFRLVGQQKHGVHGGYLISNHGRLYSLHSRNFMQINQQCRLRTILFVTDNIEW